MMRTYEGKIEVLKPNQFFVFGSNTQGRHGKGAALYARTKFGAVYGQAKGFQGQCFSIVTKDLKSQYHPSISKRNIMRQISELYDHAMNHPTLEFFIAYTNGPMLNGYTPDEMAEMFAHDLPPNNIIFEKSFAELLNKYL